MTRTVKQIFGLVLALALLTPTLAAAKGAWIHVRILGDDDDGDRVSVNMPVQTIATMLPMIESEDLRDGRIRVDGKEIDGDDLRALWKSIRESEDGVYLNMETKDESVRVAKQGHLLKIECADEAEGDQVDIQIPIAVVNALLSGEEDELDLLAGLAALEEHGDEIEVTVNDDRTAIRIWIDDDPGSDR
ncbi:MAG: hypothetical protein KDA27_00495 [Candidatus Eisenbacteria bacterium]|uniref:Copper chaperone PCu(A)C n=1 Tax=Eiseniibacteriota bacterium TaxID=2212470 RepID=A0A956SCB6_UNCEI|nr:hypothetical protein [Candidatus Eisenbacteria bacterium]MCB9462974.1 hypothetical protein [Candidatus Eisenbacteria bacterium]